MTLLSSYTYWICLVLISLIDLRTGYIPDVLVMALAFISVAHLGISGLWWLSSGLAATVLILVSWGSSWVMKRPTLGWGDVKVSAAMALGLPLLSLTHFFLTTGLIGCAWGLWVRSRGGEEDTFPLGPALCGGCVAAHLMAGGIGKCV